MVQYKEIDDIIVTTWSYKISCTIVTGYVEAFCSHSARQVIKKNIRVII